MAENTQSNMNFFKKFKSVGGDHIGTGVDNLQKNITKRFDEPTYFSFKLVFGTNGDLAYNVANNRAQYDTMPHPLFSKAGERNISVTTEYLKKQINTATNKPSDSKIVFNTPTPTYSAIKYLIHANEPTRAKMMCEFIDKFNTLQSQFPYYFQSIEGVSDLIKVDPTKGQRQSNDRKITIKCLEGLDLRVSYLLNLYRKIAWDDTYQRWILPDMMRYFTLDIYLAEFRTFHTPRSPTEVQDATNSGNVPKVGKNPLYLDVLDDVLPVWKITCEMCEFDLTDMDFGQFHGLDVAANHTPIDIKFGVKVGNIKEAQIYPMFGHTYLIDRKLNGINRYKDVISTLPGDNEWLYPASLQIAQGRIYNNDFHISGLPFNEGGNTTEMYGAGGPGVDGKWGTDDDDYSEVNPTNPATWVGNALNFGTAYGKNLAKKYIDKGKITSIPGLGVSFTEVQVAIQAKNVVGALGLIRKGFNETVKEFGEAPSERLQQPIQTDTLMLAFLTEIEKLSRSRATDEETKFLGSAASLALNDNDIMQQIKDFSLATDLVGPKEENIIKYLDGATQYGQNVNSQSLIRAGIQENNVIPSVLPNAASGELIDVGASGINQLKSSEKLSNSINTDGTKIINNSNTIKTNTIDADKIIEYPPSILLSRQIDAQKLNQPMVSKATNNKLEN